MLTLDEGAPSARSGPPPARSAKRWPGSGCRRPASRCPPRPETTIPLAGSRWSCRVPRNVTLIDGTGAPAGSPPRPARSPGCSRSKASSSTRRRRAPQRRHPAHRGSDVQLVRNGVDEVVETEPVRLPCRSSRTRAGARPEGRGRPGQGRRAGRDHADLAQNGEEIRREQIRAGADPAVPRVVRVGTNDEKAAERRSRRRPRSTTARPGTSWPSARPPATGRSTVATATTAACSSTPAPGRPSAAHHTRSCRTRPAAPSRSRSRPRSAPTAAATAPGRGAPASSASRADTRAVPPRRPRRSTSGSRGAR